MNIGIEAENVVSNYFENLGYEIIARRYKTRHGEIDIIASNAEQIVFIEVKYRKNINDCYEAISESQIRRIRNATEVFLSSKNLCSKPLRFDAVFLDTTLTIKHIQDAF